MRQLPKCGMITFAGFLVCLCTPAAEIKSGGDAQWIEDAGGTVIRDAAGRITGVDLRGKLGHGYGPSQAAATAESEFPGPFADTDYRPGNAGAEERCPASWI